MIVYEGFWSHEDDNDKARGRGGYFTTEEWKRIFEEISKKFKVELITPKKCPLGKILDTSKELRGVDIICSYVEKKSD